MKFPLSWLREHLDTSASVDAITTTLSAIGIEVEGVEDRGAALAPFRVARVVEAAPHPNADRLRALRVDLGDGRELSVVCGAPNARTGMVGVAALPGAFIPGTGVTLKAGEIRGVRSEAMMLSLREMGLGDDHSGIAELPADAPVGARYVDWAGLDDPVIEVKVTPNRGDALSVRGVARDLAAAGLGTLRPWGAEPVAPAFETPLRWRIEDPRACTWVLGRAVRDVRNGPSPRWLRDRLLAIGLRPISALVDVTNWFTFALGRPLHVFDVAKVRGGVLAMRMARPGEELPALNGRTYALSEEDGVIADAAGAESLGGIIGGEASGCDEDTTAVFIECALFDPVRIALSGRRHGIHTDARARNERGLDPALMRPALEAATRMVQDLCGGEAGTITEAGAEPAWRRTATLRFERIAGLGGLDLAPDEAVARLGRLGFAAASRDAASVTVQVPSWRNDVAAPIVLDQDPALDPARAARAAEGCAAVEAECDLLEEVLRLGGLDAVPAVSLPVASVVPRPALDARQARAALARRVLAARGLHECVTYGFTARRVAALFGETPDSLRVENPISADLDQMRPTPLATLALAAAANAARGLADVALGELGGGYRGTAPEGQLLMACGLRTGRTPASWISPARPVDAMDAKADAVALLEALGAPMAGVQATADAAAHYHPGRSGVLRQGPKVVLAQFGQLHPRLCRALDLPEGAVAFEVFLDAVPEARRRRRAAPDLPPFQPVRRDFAFLLDRDVPAEKLVRAVQAADRALIAEVAVFDRYSGPTLPEGQVSLALQVTIQPRERTLTESEIEAVASRVVAAAAPGEAQPRQPAQQQRQAGRLRDRHGAAARQARVERAGVHDLAQLRGGEVRDEFLHHGGAVGAELAQVEDLATIARRQRAERRDGAAAGEDRVQQRLPALQEAVRDRLRDGGPADAEWPRGAADVAVAGLVRQQDDVGERVRAVGQGDGLAVDAVQREGDGRVAGLGAAGGHQVLRRGGEGRGVGEVADEARHDAGVAVAHQRVGRVHATGREDAGEGADVVAQVGLHVAHAARFIHHEHDVGADRRRTGRRGHGQGGGCQPGHEETSHDRIPC